MIFQSKKVVAYIMVFTFLSAVYFGCKFLFGLPFFVGQEVNIQKINVDTKPLITPEIETTTNTQELKEREENIDFSKPVLIDGKPYYLLFADDLGEIKNWLGNRGYIKKEARATYESYSETVLKELAKNGDLSALDVLIDKAIEARDEKIAMSYITLAAVHGSTTALDTLTLYTSPRLGIHTNATLARTQALETLAIVKVIELRGDRTLAHRSRTGIDNLYEFRYDTALVLTSGEQEAVDRRAQEVYDELQNLRHKNGLGDFDNSEPSAIKKVFGLD